MDILEGNPYAKFLRKLNDFPSLEDFKIIINRDAAVDQRVYNSPTVDQVAAVWVEGNNDNVPYEREIVIHSHSSKNHQVKHYFGCYGPLHYPLLFPGGDVGWHQNIKRRDKNDIHRSKQVNTISQVTQQTFTSAEDIFKREREGVKAPKAGSVSCREYYCYKFQIRDTRQSTVLTSAGRLFHQYAVDMYIKLETTRLNYFRKKQSEIRAELFQGIVDSVAAGEAKACQVGKRIVLPSLFISGPRDMRRRYLDAMSLVQQFGKPDIFITMTCNPEWEEITEELHPGQTHNDRPDLTSRIFRGKLQDLKDQLFKKEIFGKVAAHVHVIEFQKRGLPHAHMLIILMGKHKIVSSDHYDKYVSAEIPNQYENPILYELVKKHMMHGPCGELNTKNVCMQNGECKYHYPREFSPRSLQAKDAYPVYKRSKNNRTMLVRNKILNNQWVVPYNPYLLTRYNCHINVEICSGIKAVKYLYKYIYKGHDRVAVDIEYNEGEKVVNEIKNFQDARWVSAQEAFWRIYEFHLNEIFPAVINLQLHMPNHQYVSYWKHQDLSKLIHLEHVSKTMLTEFFTMCKKIKEGNKKKHEKDHEKELLYVEFPEYYVWDSTSKS
ncbi:uncharacterized protein LOC109838340 [Asparagus officinalis]|uniref:uncharacterized protein LOC109838340 n=1 Tax=Asparagus officinalis TaxID=4686 RepID=UPI00098DE87E|nr:uncharacterized protein LOC109838340 [Asparagus officinalis]